MRWLVAVTCLCAGPIGAQTIIGASFDDPTTRYDHGILGDAVEYGALRFTVMAPDGTDTGYVVTLPETHVFEDLVPRLWDLTGDGRPEIVVVETDVGRGAALAVYGISGKIAQTPYIGQTHRWLAPIGAADLDGDGRIEVAYIDRPHLAKTLRIWEWQGGGLVEDTDIAGLTNHRIGDITILGGIADCTTGPEIITASADWSRIVATVFDSDTYISRDIAPNSAATLDAALNCRN